MLRVASGRVTSRLGHYSRASSSEIFTRFGRKGWRFVSAMLSGDYDYAS